MIVPEFGAGAKAQNRVTGRQVTVRRFGWSNASTAEAKALAEVRDHEAMNRLLRGERLPRRELKRACNGSVGVPIREEVIARQGELVITRNGYGALCLNTPNVLFVDIDFEERPGWLALSAGLAVGLLEFAVIALVVLRNPPFRGAALLFVALTALIAALVLAMHPTFDPNEPAVSECFSARRTDPLYFHMCQRQHSFRARISPAPWRIGIAQHLKPRPGVWPITPERMDDCRRWVPSTNARHADSPPAGFSNPWEAARSTRLPPRCKRSTTN